MVGTVVKINTLTFKIWLVERESEHLKLNDPTLLNAGVTDFHDLAIYLDKTLPIDNFERTLKHELTHAYIFAYGFGNVLDNEEVCDFVASYLVDIEDHYQYIRSCTVNHLTENTR